MKHLFILVFLFFSVAMMGQMRPGMARHGMGRNAPAMPPPQPKKAKKVDVIEETMKEMTKDVKLDNLQEAIIRGHLIELKEQVDAIVATDSPDEGKKEGIEIIRRKFEDKVKSVLNPNQLEPFAKFMKKYAK